MSFEGVDEKNIDLLRKSRESIDKMQMLLEEFPVLVGNLALSALLEATLVDFAKDIHEINEFLENMRIRTHEILKKK